jgi:predicted histidine transporter YuiF (NhaC family)
MAICGKILTCAVGWGSIGHDSGVQARYVSFHHPSLSGDSVTGLGTQSLQWLGILYRLGTGSASEICPELSQRFVPLSISLAVVLPRIVWPETSRSYSTLGYIQPGATEITSSVSTRELI